MATDSMLYTKFFESCPRGWSVVPFDEAIDFQEGPGILAVDFHKTGIPLIRLSGVQGNMVSLKGCNYLSQEKVDRKWSHFRLARGDLLISTSATIGMVSEVGTEAEGAIAYTGLIRLRPRDKRVHPGFIKYFAKSGLFIKQAEGMAAGSVMRHFGPSHLRQMSFVIPPFYEQKRIADILGALDDKIELNRKMNETLEQMAKALFKSWFVDFDPVHAKAAGRQPSGMEKATADLFPDSFVDSELGKIPKGWRVASFAEHMEAVRGLSYNGDGLTSEGMGLPMHNLNSVYEGGGYKHEGLKFYNGEFKEKHVIQPGDMIVTNTEQGFDHLLIGHAAIVPGRYGDRGIFSHHLYRVRPRSNSPLTAYYLTQLFNNPRWHYWISGFSNGTTINMLPLDALEMPKLVVPAAELIEKFSQSAKALDDKFEGNLKEIEALTNLRDTLLPRLLGGELPTESR